MRFPRVLKSPENAFSPTSKVHKKPYSTSLWVSKSFIFKEILVGTEGKNWTEHIILNERWWSFSFRVDDDSTWKEKILQHLRGVSA